MSKSLVSPVLLFSFLIFFDFYITVFFFLLLFTSLLKFLLILFIILLLFYLIEELLASMFLSKIISSTTFDYVVFLSFFSYPYAIFIKKSCYTLIGETDKSCIYKCPVFYNLLLTSLDKYWSCLITFFIIIYALANESLVFLPKFRG